MQKSAFGMDHLSQLSEAQQNQRLLGTKRPYSPSFPLGLSRTHRSEHWHKRLENQADLQLHLSYQTDQILDQQPSQDARQDGQLC